MVELVSWASDMRKRWCQIIQARAFLSSRVELPGSPQPDFLSRLLLRGGVSERSFLDFLQIKGADVSMMISIPASAVMGAKAARTSITQNKYQQLVQLESPILRP